MIITIRKAGPGGTGEALGTIDATRLEPGIRHDLSVQLEALADLTSSHEPSAAEGLRFEVEVLGPGHQASFLVVEEGDNPEHPATRALAVLMRTLGLALPAPVS